MSHRKAKPTGGKPVGGEGEAGIIGTSDVEYSLIPPRLSSPRRRLDPKIGALLKLDVCEVRLQQARAHGDEDRFSRYYLSWCRLHSLAFSYGRFAKGASDG